MGRPMIAMRRGPPIALEGLGRRLRQGGEHGVEQVARATAVQRRDRHRLAQPEVPQPVGLGLGALVVHLVRREYDGLAGLAQDPDHGLVVVGDPDPGVDHEQHRVGDVHRDLGLGTDALGEPAGVGVPAAGVDDGEGAAVPVGVVGDPVAGDAGDVLDHGLAAADDPVDQGRLAHVGAADDGQDRHPGVGGLGGDGSCSLLLALGWAERAGQGHAGRRPRPRAWSAGSRR